MFEIVSLELSVEAQVAQNMGDEDWEELIDQLYPILAEGCSRKAPVGAYTTEAE